MELVKTNEMTMEWRSYMEYLTLFCQGFAFMTFEINFNSVVI